MSSELLTHCLLCRLQSRLPPAVVLWCSLLPCRQPNESSPFISRQFTMAKKCRSLTIAALLATACLSGIAHAQMGTATATLSGSQQAREVLLQLSQAHARPN